MMPILDVDKYIMWCYSFYNVFYTDNVSYTGIE